MNAPEKPHQSKQIPEEVALGEASFTSFPYSELRNSEDRDIFAAARIRRFSQSVLSAEAWFQSANELLTAMDVLEPYLESFWESVHSLTINQKHDVAPKHRKSDRETKHNLINQHMMLAGFAIENLCKGYLAGALSPKDQEDVKAGTLPRTLITHDVLELVRTNGMTLSDREEDLLERIGEAAIWRGCYPSPIRHTKIAPFTQWEDDIGRIKTFLPKLRRHVGAEDS